MRPVYVLGGGWVSSLGYGLLHSNKIRPEFTTGPSKLPDIREYIGNPSSRYSRFDAYTAQGYLCAALALRDAGIPEQRETALDVGILVSSRFDCIATDLAFHESTLENGGEFASPQLFSYTLPGIVMGEIAVTFKLNGPTLSFGEEESGFGSAALKNARLLLEEKLCDTLLVGWNDAPPNIFREESGYFHGACFVVLSTKPDTGKNTLYLELSADSISGLFEYKGNK